jgi:DNA polymerase type B, organellar and viral
VKSLFEIIKVNFNELYKLESINLNKLVSISSAAMNIYLANYYDPIKTPIHIPHYKQYIDIKKAFYGGNVEVFKCYGENLYWYDVVSLYPAQMKKDMPIGNLIKSNDTDSDNYFGFCYASVDVPEGSYSPVLPFRDDNNNIFYPVGNWEGWYPSVMLKNARDNYGVKVKVHWGYKQEANDTVFQEFIDRFVKLKKDAELDNNSSRRNRAKLILNSNFGRWGLNYDPYKIEILDSESAKEIFLKYEVIYHELFDNENNLEYIKYKTKPLNILKDIDIETYNILKYKDDIKIDFIIRNIPIAAMTTGHASVFMSKFLNLEDNPCYYTDTDSCFLSKKLDEQYVGNNLGQLAFKGLVKRAYFISPKLYCLIMENGDIIIKSKGISSKNLTEQDFVEMLYGICKIIPIERFEKKN